MSNALSHHFKKMFILIIGVLIAASACAPGVSSGAPDPSTSTTSTIINSTTTSTSPATTIPTTSSTTTSTTVAPTTTSTSTTTPATTTTTTVPSTTYAFTVKVGYTNTLVASAGGETALRAMIVAQLHDVESRFVGFTHDYKFTPVSFYSYSGSSDFEASRPHTEADLLLIYDERDTANGGWDGSTHSVIHSWQEAGSTLAVFSAHATQGLSHEFGHPLGAIDIYAMDVNASTNPISHTDFHSADNFDSIMRYPYDRPPLWDAYSRCIIEKNGAHFDPAVPAVSQTLPSAYQVKVTSTSGASISGASVKLYPVNWYSYAVSSTASVTGSTASNGVFQLPANPFHPMEDPNAPWRTAASNFLIQVTKGSQTSYTWLPIAAAGLAACNGQSDLTITIALP